MVFRALDAVFSSACPVHFARTHAFRNSRDILHSVGAELETAADLLRAAYSMGVYGVLHDR